MVAVGISTDISKAIEDEMHKDTQKVLENLMTTLDECRKISDDNQEKWGKMSNEMRKEFQKIVDEDLDRSERFQTQLISVSHFVPVRSFETVTLKLTVELKIQRKWRTARIACMVTSAVISYNMVPVYHYWVGSKWFAHFPEPAFPLINVCVIVIMLCSHFVVGSCYM